MKEAVYYTHTGNDGVASTLDELCFVLRENADGSCDVVIFPVGGPVKFDHVWPFDPEDPYLTTGHNYIRDEGADAPDFKNRFRYDNDPEMAALIFKQRQARDAAPGNKREELRKQHQQEQAELMKKLDEKYAPADAKPAEAPKSEPKQEPKPVPVDENGGRRA